jgi:hypothetical protein
MNGKGIGAAEKSLCGEEERMEHVWLGPGPQQVDLAEIVGKIKGQETVLRSGPDLV